MDIQTLVNRYIDACPYRDKGKYGVLNYHRSPLSHFQDLWHFSGKRPDQIPEHVYRPIFGNINPDLIHRLQEIWVMPMEMMTRRDLYEALAQHLADPTLRGHTRKLPSGYEQLAYWKEPATCTA